MVCIVIFNEFSSFSILIGWIMHIKRALKAETILAGKSNSALPFVPNASSATKPPVKLMPYRAFSAGLLAIFIVSTL